jgi:hypothetical protein
MKVRVGEEKYILFWPDASPNENKPMNYLAGVYVNLFDWLPDRDASTPANFFLQSRRI